MTTADFDVRAINWLPRGALRWPKIDHRAHVVAPAPDGRSPDAAPCAI